MAQIRQNLDEMRQRVIALRADATERLNQVMELQQKMNEERQAAS